MPIVTWSSGPCCLYLKSPKTHMRSSISACGWNAFPPQNSQGLRWWEGQRDDNFHLHVSPRPLHKQAQPWLLCGGWQSNSPHVERPIGASLDHQPPLISICPVKGPSTKKCLQRLCLKQWMDDFLAKSI